ncbi:MAG: hypothetical protein ACC608_10490 [Anaerofustis sp.]
MTFDAKNDGQESQTEKVKKQSRENGEKQADKKKEKSGKKFFTKKKIIIFSSVGVLLVAAAVYLIFFTGSSKKFEAVNQVGDVLNNGTIEVTFQSAQTTTSIPGYELDSDYVYVELLYTIKNISGTTIDWEEFPYVSMMKYENSGTVYKQVSGSEADFDFNALQYYALSEGIDYSNVLDDMQPDEVRTDSDVVKIPASQFSTDSWFVTIDNIDAIVQINLENGTDTTGVK